MVDGSMKNPDRPGKYPEFLSEEDVDLQNVEWDELLSIWNQWLRQAQSTNEEDCETYEHGVFMTDPTFRNGDINKR